MNIWNWHLRPAKPSSNSDAYVQTASVDCPSLRAPALVNPSDLHCPPRNRTGADSLRWPMCLHTRTRRRSARSPHRNCRLTKLASQEANTRGRLESPPRAAPTWHVFACLPNRAPIGPKFDLGAKFSLHARAPFLVKYPNSCRAGRPRASINSTLVVAIGWDCTVLRGTGPGPIPCAGQCACTHGLVAAPLARHTEMTG